MYDIMTIGTLTIDLFFKGESLTNSEHRFNLAMGGKYFTDHFYEGLGGGAANVAIGLQRHNINTSLMTLIGKNGFRPMITAKLQDEGISYVHSKFVDDYLNVSCILLAETGEKSVINYQTPHQHLFSDEKDYEGILRAKIIYLANLPDVSYFNKLKLLKYLKRHGKKVIMNMGVVDCRRPKEQTYQLLEQIDILIVNGYEFADLVKTPYDRISFHKNLAPFYFNDFKDKIFIVTDGEKGSFGYSDNKVHIQRGIEPAKIIDSTGAGDAYSAGFIAGFFKTNSIEKSMLSGAQYACKALGKIGAN